MASEGTELLVDLVGELACWSDHQGEDAVRVLRKLLKDWKGKTRGFTTTGMGASNDVVSVQTRFEGVVLDLCGVLDADLLEILDEPGSQADLGERIRIFRFLLLFLSNDDLRSNRDRNFFYSFLVLLLRL